MSSTTGGASDAGARDMAQALEAMSERRTFGVFWQGVKDEKPDLDLLRANSWMLHREVNSSGERVSFLRALLNERDFDTAAFAIDLGAPLEARDNHGRTVLHEVLRVLSVTAGPDPWPLVEKLAAAGARFDTLDDAGMPIWVWGHLPPERLQFLLRNGACVEPEYRALSKLIANCVGCEEDQLEASIQALLDAGVPFNPSDVESVEHHPLGVALLNRQVKTAMLLMDRGADIDMKDARGAGFLHMLVHPDILKFLLSAGLEVNAKDKQRTTPFARMTHAAFHKGGSWGLDDHLLVLLAAGADPGLKSDSHDWSPETMIRLNPRWFPRVEPALQARETRSAVLGVLGEIEAQSLRL